MSKRRIIEATPRLGGRVQSVASADGAVVTVGPSLGGWGRAVASTSETEDSVMTEAQARKSRLKPLEEEGGTS